MSHILEALRRSEQERLSRKAADLTSVTLGVAPRRKRFPWGLIALGFVLLVLMGALIGLMPMGMFTFGSKALDGQQCETPTESIQQSDYLWPGIALNSRFGGEALKPSPTPVEQSDVTPAPASNLLGGSSVLKDKTQEQADPSITDPASPEALKNMREIYEADDEEEPSNPARKSSADAMVLSGGVQEDLPAFHDLPVEIRAKIPTMRISLYAYSEVPQERFLIVNGKKCRVGEEMVEGVQLVHIGAQVAVLQMNSQKFTVPR